MRSLAVLMCVVGATWAQDCEGLDKKVMEFMECQDSEMEKRLEAGRPKMKDMMGKVMVNVLQCFDSQGCPDPLETIQGVLSCKMGVFNSQIKPVLENAAAESCQGVDLPNMEAVNPQAFAMRKLKKMAQKMKKGLKAAMGKMRGMFGDEGPPPEVKEVIMGRIKAKASKVVAKLCDGDAEKASGVIDCVKESMGPMMEEMKAELGSETPPSRSEMSAAKCGAQRTCLKRTGLGACQAAFEERRGQLCSCAGDVMQNMASRAPKKLSEIAGSAKACMGDLPMGGGPGGKGKGKSVLSQLASRGPGPLKAMLGKFCNQLGPFQPCDAPPLPPQGPPPPFPPDF